ncbi:MFS transporter [Pseudofrancisella aestuarii]|uniref:MFS transporter n=1 Tax=Pseudofrancisella aestuarii TaxID=2670347 RepID=A0ABV9TCF3_9GAMM|nr:MFS transporter [Pseudofrancisella aestuarii]
MLLSSVARTLKSSFGNIIEWYDFSLYGYFATIIATQFFPSNNHWMSLMAAFGAFGVGFIARPVGSILFGYIGDKVGRHYAMNISITLMSMSTMAVAFLPTSEQIGLFAPLLLVMIRLLQGLSAGGQFGNLLTITAEDKALKYRGLGLGIAYSTSVVGYLIAAGVSYGLFSLLAKEDQTWAWRIPFALSFILLIIHLFLRENDKGEVNNAPRERTPVQILLKHYSKRLILIVVLSTCTGGLYFLVVTYMVSYMETELGLSISTALGVSTLGLIGICISTPLFGFLSDIIGRKKFHIVAYLTVSLIMIPLVLAMHIQNIYIIAISVFLLAVTTALTQGASNPYFTEVFPPQVRAIGCSIGLGFGNAISGFMPMIATYVMGITSSTKGLSILLLLISAIGLFIALIIPNQQAEVRRLNSIHND